MLAYNDRKNQLEKDKHLGYEGLQRYVVLQVKKYPIRCLTNSDLVSNNFRPSHPTKMSLHQNSVRLMGSKRLLSLPQINLHFFLQLP